MAIAKKTEHEYNKINKVQNYLGRWDNFKQRRLELIDKYIYLRKRQLTAYSAIKLVTCIIGLKNFLKSYRK